MVSSLVGLSSPIIANYPIAFIVSLLPCPCECQLIGWEKTDIFTVTLHVWFNQIIAYFGNFVAFRLKYYDHLSKWCYHWSESEPSQFPASAWDAIHRSFLITVFRIGPNGVQLKSPKEAYSSDNRWRSDQKWPPAVEQVRVLSEGQRILAGHCVEHCLLRAITDGFSSVA